MADPTEPYPGERVTRLWTPERVPLTLPLAGIGERALAYAIDVSIVGGALMAALFIYNFWGDIEQDLGQLSGAGLALFAAVLFALAVGYDVVFDLFGAGATPGKRFVRLRVLTRTGDTPDFLTSLMRNVLRLLDVLPGGYGVGAVALFLTGTQRLGDLVAGTVVVSERARARSPLDVARVYAAGAPRLADAPPVADEQVQLLLTALEVSAALTAAQADRRLATAVARVAPALEDLAIAEGGRVVAARLLLALAERRQGLAAELLRVGDAEARLRAALAALARAPSMAAAFEVDDAIRHAASALLRATRLKVPARRLEALSLDLLEAERQRRVQERSGRQLRRLLVEDIPAAIWEERRTVVRAAAVLFGAAGLGFAVAYADETVGRALLGDEIASMVDQGAAWTDDIERQGSYAQTALRIIVNNVRVGFLGFAAGLLGGVGTLLLLTLNGLHLGAVFGFAAGLGTASTLGKFILAHGPVELSAICVAGAAGLCVGRAVINPGARTRRAALRDEGKKGALILAGATLGFLLIGTVEGFVSPGKLFPWPVNAVVGVGMWSLFYAWIRVYGGRVTRPAPTSALAPQEGSPSPSA